MFPELTNFAYCTFVVYTDFGVEPLNVIFSNYFKKRLLPYVKDEYIL